MVRRLWVLPLSMGVLACDGKDTETTAPVDADGDGFFAAEDCDDQDPAIAPGVGELCDGIDNDCDGSVDEDADDVLAFYEDSDQDGYGDYFSEEEACEAPDGYVSDSTDCNDLDGAISPGADEICDGIDNNCDAAIDEDAAVDAPSWYADADSDGFGDADDSTRACAQPDGYVSDSTDCDDVRADVRPDAQEVCSGIDEDCDGLIDDDDDSTDTSTGATFYADHDTDSYGDPRAATQACLQPDGYVTDSTDCDDNNSAVSPAAAEVCDGADTDEDCDGLADDDDGSTDASGMLGWYADTDGDGYGDDSFTPVVRCDEPTLGGRAYVTDSTDCDDNNSAVSPAAAEVCDGADTDEDCDGLADDDDSSTDASGMLDWYADTDGDGYGDAASSAAACDQPTGYTSDDTDCDDADSGINPGAAEVCDSADADEDCDGLADDDDSSTDEGSLLSWHPDDDGDGYGDEDSATYACAQPSGYTSDGSDCDDSDSSINPGATEACDAVDNDCDPSSTASGATWQATTASTPTDISSTLAAGSYSSPATYTISTAGTMVICDNTYTATITVSADATIVGEDATLQGGRYTNLIIVDSGADVTLRGLTLKDAQGSYSTSYSGGGLYCSGSSTVAIDEVTFDSNDAPQNGGAIYSSGCDITVTDSEFFDNNGRYGALYISGGSFTATDTLFEGNTASSSSYTSGRIGGAIYSYYSDLTFEDCEFIDNTSGDDGGAIYLNYGSMDFTDTVFDGNTAGDNGGAFEAWQASVTCTETSGGTSGVINSSASASYRPAAVRLSAATLDSVGCDWGTSSGGDDNTPADISTQGYTYSSYGDNETFSCDTTGCY